MNINRLHTFYTVQIPNLQVLLTRCYTSRQLIPEDSPGTLSTVSIECNAVPVMWIILNARFLTVYDFLFVLSRIARWPSAGKELSSWLSVFATLMLCHLNCMCTFPILVQAALSKFGLPCAFLCKSELYSFS